MNPSASNLIKQKIIIPKGTIDRNQIAVIEIPYEYKDEPIVVVTGKPQTCLRSDASANSSSFGQADVTFRPPFDACSTKIGQLDDRDHPSQLRTDFMSCLERCTGGAVEPSEMVSGEACLEHCMKRLQQGEEAACVGGGPKKNETKTCFETCTGTSLVQSGEMEGLSCFDQCAAVLQQKEGQAPTEPCPMNTSFGTSTPIRVVVNQSSRPTDQTKSSQMESGGQSCSDRCTMKGQLQSEAEESSLELQESGEMDSSFLAQAEVTDPSSAEATAGSSLGVTDTSLDEKAEIADERQTDGAEAPAESIDEPGMQQDEETSAGTTDKNSVGLMKPEQKDSILSACSGKCGAEITDQTSFRHIAGPSNPCIDQSEAKLMYLSQAMATYDSNSLGLLMSDFMNSSFGATPSGGYPKPRTDHSSLGVMHSSQMSSDSSGPCMDQCTTDPEVLKAQTAGGCGRPGLNSMPTKCNRKICPSAFLKRKLERMEDTDSSLGLILIDTTALDTSSGGCGNRSCGKGPKKSGPSSLGMSDLSGFGMDFSQMTSSFRPGADMCSTKVQFADSDKVPECCKSMFVTDLGNLDLSQSDKLSNIFGNIPHCCKSMLDADAMQSDQMQSAFGPSRYGTDPSTLGIIEISQNGGFDQSEQSTDQSSLELIQSEQMSTGFGQSSRTTDPSPMHSSQMGSAGCCKGGCCSKMHHSQSDSSSLGIMNLSQLSSFGSPNLSRSGYSADQSSLGLMQPDQMSTGFGQPGNNTDPNSLGLLQSMQMSSYGSCKDKCLSQSRSATEPSSLGIMQLHQMSSFPRSGYGTDQSSLGIMPPGHMSSGFGQFNPNSLGPMHSSQMSSFPFPQSRQVDQTSLGLMPSSQMSSFGYSSSGVSGYSADKSSLGLMRSGQMNSGFATDLSSFGPCTGKCSTPIQFTESRSATEPSSLGLMEPSQMRSNLITMQSSHPTSLGLMQSGQMRSGFGTDQSSLGTMHSSQMSEPRACEFCLRKCAQMWSQSQAITTGNSSLGVMKTNEMDTSFDKSGTQAQANVDNSSIGLMKSDDMKSDLEKSIAGEDASLGILKSTDMDSTLASDKSKPSAATEGSADSLGLMKSSEINRTLGSSSGQTTDQSLGILKSGEMGTIGSHTVGFTDDSRLGLMKSSQMSSSLPSGTKGSGSLGIMQSKQMDSTFGSKCGPCGRGRGTPSSITDQSSLGLMQSQQIDSTFGSNRATTSGISDQNSLGLVQSQQMDTSFGSKCGPCSRGRGTPYGISNQNSLGLMQARQMDSTFGSNRAMASGISNQSNLGLMQSRQVDIPYGPKYGTGPGILGISDQSSLGLMQSQQMDSSFGAKCGPCGRGCGTPDQSSLGLMQSRQMDSSIGSNRANASGITDQSSLGLIQSQQMDISYGPKYGRGQGTPGISDPSSLGLMQSRQMDSSFGSRCGPCGRGRGAPSGISNQSSLGLMQSGQMNSAYGCRSTPFGKVSDQSRLGLMPPHQMQDSLGQAHSGFGAGVMASSTPNQRTSVRKVIRTTTVTESPQVVNIDGRPKAYKTITRTTTVTESPVGQSSGATNNGLDNVTNASSLGLLPSQQNYSTFGTSYSGPNESLGLLPSRWLNSNCITNESMGPMRSQQMRSYFGTSQSEPNNSLGLLRPDQMHSTNPMDDSLGLLPSEEMDGTLSSPVVTKIYKKTTTRVVNSSPSFS